MKIKDTMSKKIITCNSNSSIFEVAKLMKENNIGLIPIVDDNLIGVITDRDIVVKCIFNNNDTIKPYITNNIISIDEDKDIENALELMKKNKIKRLIITKKNNLIGILSLSDILSIYVDNEILINTLKSIYELKDNTPK